MSIKYPAEEETNAMFTNFATNLANDVKKLGKGSFGTVILGLWKSMYESSFINHKQAFV